jgi:copper chaperone
MTNRTFVVPNISCHHCVMTIEMEVGELPGVTSVRADEQSKEVSVSWEDPATWDSINALLVGINYPPQGLIQID